VYLACDLTATVTKDAHHHDRACGDRRARDGNLRRLLLRSARGLDAADLEAENESDGAWEARDQPARVDDRTPHSAELSCEHVLLEVVGTAG